MKIIKHKNLMKLSIQMIKAAFIFRLSSTTVLYLYTVNPVILIRHTEFHMQPTSAGPGTRAHDTHGMPKSAQHVLI
jgi:hypothetical protein